MPVQVIVTSAGHIHAETTCHMSCKQHVTCLSHANITCCKHATVHVKYMIVTCHVEK